MPQDPSGLFARIPELEPLAQDPAVAAAVESGDLFRVYRALQMAKLFGRLPTQRSALESVLANRRAFAKPIVKSPSLHTVNGFGTGFVGKSDEQPDGTYIAMHALVFLFFIPVFPFGAYVVRKASGGVRSTWNIFARVPPGLGSVLYRKLAGVGVATGLACAALLAFHAARHQQMRVVNGFDVPVQATIGALHVDVPARGDASIEVPSGMTHLRAQAGEVVLDERDVQVPSRRDLFAWNIAGAMPLYRAEIYYEEKPLPESDSSKLLDLYCGVPIVDVDPVAFVLKEPEHEISLGEHEKRAVRVQVDYPRTDIKEGQYTRICVGAMEKKAQYAEAARLLAPLAALDKWSADATMSAVQTALLAGDAEGASALAKKGRDAHEGDIEAARLYQDASARAGHAAAVLEEYKARAAAHPDDASAQYLAIRLQSGPAAHAQLEALLQRFPRDPYLLKSVVFAREQSENWAGASEAWERLEKVSAPLAGEAAELQVWALAARGKRAQAIALAQQMISDGPEGERDDMLVRAAQLSGHEQGEALIAGIESDSPGSLAAERARAGLALPADAKDARAKLIRAVATDAAAALQLGRSCSQLELAQLDRTTWTLLALDAARVNDTELHQSLLRVRMLDPHELEVAEAFARGQKAELEQIDLEPEVRAAVLAVRARNASLPAQERKELAARARKLDAVHGIVTAALDASKA